MTSPEPSVEAAIAGPSRGAGLPVPWLPVIVAATGAGLLLLGVADAQARAAGPFSQLLFWAGVLLIMGPSTWRLLSAGPTRNERVVIAVLFGFALYVVKVMVNPIGFALPDEFTHWRTLNDILSTSHLFADNPLLQISPVFPGLEAATAAASVSSGLGAFPLALLVIGVARVVTMLGIFLLASITTGSSRVAGVACVVYAANASFLPFDAQFSYESLALPLAIVALWAVLRWSRHGGRSALHGGLALGAITATAVTHHLTSLVLLAFLATWSVATLIRRRSPAQRRPVLVATGWAILVNTIWLVTIGSLALTYLDTIVQGGVTELAGVLSGHAPPKQLFAPGVGLPVPPPEVVLAYGAVGLLLLALPFLLWHVVRDRNSTPFVIVLALAALSYPGTLALRFTVAGSEASQRASEFIFLALGILGADWLLSRQPSRWRLDRRSVRLTALLVIFAGGIVAGDPPQGRLPGPYEVAAEARSIEPEGIDTAQWALSQLGPGNRLIADRTNAKLLGSIGSQYPVTAANSHYATAYVVFDETLGPADLAVLRNAGIQFVVVDLRLATSPPVYKYLFENAEPDAGHHTTPMSLTALQKFDAAPGVRRVYDSGDIIIYDVRGLLNAAP